MGASLGHLLALPQTHFLVLLPGGRTPAFQPLTLPL